MSKEKQEENNALAEERQSSNKSSKRVTKRRPVDQVDRFHWGEVDERESESVDDLIVPVTVPKKKRRKQKQPLSESADTRCVVSNTRARVRPTPNLNLPSYGRIPSDLEDDSLDDFELAMEAVLAQDDDPETSTGSTPVGRTKKSNTGQNGRKKSSPPKKQDSSAKPQKPSTQENSFDSGNVADHLTLPEKLPPVKQQSAKQPLEKLLPEKQPSKKLPPEKQLPEKHLPERQESHSTDESAEVSKGTVPVRFIRGLKRRAANVLRGAGYSSEEVDHLLELGENSYTDSLFYLLEAVLDARKKTDSQVVNTQTIDSPVVAPQIVDTQGESSKPIFQQPSMLQVPYLTEDASGTLAFPVGFESCSQVEEVPEFLQDLEQDLDLDQVEIEVIAPPTSDHQVKVSRFSDLNLSPVMLRTLQEAGYETPTPVQAGTIDRVMAGNDLIGQAKTGTGKTAAFAIPIIEQVESCAPGKMPVALIIVPTRELAVQVRDEVIKLSRGFEVETVACYGGKPLAEQIKKLSGGVDIVVGTPGRIIDLVNRQALSLNTLRWVVLDEADRMLDIGFRPDIEKILRQTPRTRQTLLFSATLPPPVIQLAKNYMTEPEQYDFSSKDISSETIEQFYITVDRERKFDALLCLLEQEKPQQAIVFCRTKRAVDRISQHLQKVKKHVAAIHGDLAQTVRDSVMRNLRSGNVGILVATDVVGRGIDVSGISHIINYDVPQFCDDYVHRVGRTGRMGREGVAYTLVTSQEGPELTRIEKRINRLLKRAELEGFVTYSKPVDDSEEEKQESKPVYGKQPRRLRRAL